MNRPEPRTFPGMKQISLGLNLSTKKKRKREFPKEMARAVPWGVLVQIVEPHYPRATTGRAPFAFETMLCVHYLQQWFANSDPAMEEALHHMPVFREFAKLSEGATRLPDETTILRIAGMSASAGRECARRLRKPFVPGPLATLEPASRASMRDQSSSLSLRVTLCRLSPTIYALPHCF